MYPFGFHLRTPRMALIGMDKDVKHRVLGFYNGREADPIFIIAVGPAAALKKLQEAGKPNIGPTAQQKKSH